MPEELSSEPPLSSYEDNGFIIILSDYVVFHMAKKTIAIRT
ncbi:hypothetical protein DSUL_170047 [Desulfovibrionales bacterium]